MVIAILLLANERGYMDKKQVKSILFIGFILITFCWIINNMDKCLLLIGNFIHLFLPFLFGAAIAFILNVPMKQIEKKKTQRATATGTLGGLGGGQFNQPKDSK